MRIYFREYIISISFHHLITFIFASLDDATMALRIYYETKDLSKYQTFLWTRKQTNQTRLEDAKEKKADSKTEEET